MSSKFWMGTSVGLAVALVLAFLLLPPWSPVSVTTPPGLVIGGGAATPPPIGSGPGQKTSTSPASAEAPGTTSPGSVAAPRTVPTTTPPAPTPAPTEARPGSVSTVQSLGALSGQSPPDVDALIAATENPDWGVRWDAVDTLGTLKERRGIPALAKRALHDDNPHPRWRSLWALSSVDLAGTEAIPLFLAGLEDQDPVVVYNAAIALAFFRQAQGRPQLLKSLQHPDSFVRWAAAFMLSEIGNPEVVDGLVPLLNPTRELDASVRGETALSLGRIKDNKATPPLVDALRKDPSPQVRWRAAMALSQLSNASMAAELEQALATENDSQVRGAIEEALAQLKRATGTPQS